MIEWVRPPLSKNKYEAPWRLLSVQGIVLTIVCVITASTEIEKTLCSFWEVETFELPWESKSALQNLYSKVGQQKHACRFSKQDGHLRDGSRGDGYPKSPEKSPTALLSPPSVPGQFTPESKVCLRSMKGSLLFPTLPCFFFHGPSVLTYTPTGSFPSHPLILSHLLTFCPCLSPFLPFAPLFSEPCRESFSCFSSFLT